jgi:hypothetical protein
VPRYLTHKPPGRRVDAGAATRYAAGQRGVSTWRIGWEILRLSYGAGGLSSDDYFLHGAWQPGLTWSQRKEFVGSSVNLALNRSLTPPRKEKADDATDKLAAAERFSMASLPQPRILAVAATEVPGSGARWLDGPEATLEFLMAPGCLPCFGKPVHESLSTGAASFVAVDDDGTIVFGSGQRVPPQDLVREIWDDYGRGFVFQELVRPHPGLASLIGPVIGSLRVVTIDDGRGPTPLYAVLKIPAAGAMVDGSAGPVGCAAAIDLETGGVLRLQDRRQMGGTSLDHFPVTGAKVEGAVLPDFAEALKLAVLAHEAIGNRGILGADILLSDRGPLVNEMNTNPFHAVYQSAFARGLLNPDLLPGLRAVRARIRDITPSSSKAGLLD